MGFENCPFVSWWLCRPMIWRLSKICWLPTVLHPGYRERNYPISDLSLIFRTHLYFRLLPSTIRSFLSQVFSSLLKIGDFLPLNFSTQRFYLILPKNRLWLVCWFRLQQAEFGCCCRLFGIFFDHLDQLWTLVSCELIRSYSEAALLELFLRSRMCAFASWS